MFTSPPPVNWVNPQMMRDFPPPTLPYYQGMPYPCVDPGGGLWHPAPPGGLQLQQMVDPLQMLQTYPVLPSSKIQGSVYTPSCLPPKGTTKASTKPLNPNAQEWVPRDYRKSPPAMPEAPASVYVEDRASHPHSDNIPLIPNGYQDFCEITEKEVEEARFNEHQSSSDVLATYGTNGVGKCQVPVPQCPPATRCDLVEKVTPDLTTSTPRTEGREGKFTSQTCLESTMAGERKAESEVQSSQSQGPLCTWENCASPAVVSEENRSESASQLCVTLCPEEKKSPSPEQASESKGSCSVGVNGASPIPVSLNSERSPQSVSPSSSERCTRPDQDQDQQSADPDLMRTMRQSDSNLTSPTQAANSATEGRLSPVTHEKSVRAGLKMSPSPQCLESATENTASLSYAGVVGRASVSPPPPVESPEQQKYKKVEQPLPKIFQRNTTPPREADVSMVQGERQALNLFRRPSKTQRTRSRKFLQELKESSHSGGDVWCSSSPSSTSDLSQSPDDLFSPSSSPLAVTRLPVSPPRCTPTMATSSPKAIPNRAASSGLLESPGSRTRSSSESSAASLDIEFVEQDEVDRAAVERTPPIKGKHGLGGTNGFLACILGSGDSDSEDEDEDESDLDWDEVCKDTPLELDDSWETFGFGLVVVQCQMAPLQAQSCSPAEPTKAEECGSDSFLKEVNKRWEQEVGKDVRGRSSPRVTFGGQKVQRMVAWDHAYREARRGPWEEQARDRARFAQRVATLEPTLSKVLDPGHRRAVYRRLYAPPPPRCFL